jgi:hypothetical protein
MSGSVYSVSAPVGAMESIAQDSSVAASAPEWVRALQAALHADMEADNYTGEGSRRQGRRDLNDIKSRYGASGSFEDGQHATDSITVPVIELEDDGEEENSVKQIINEMISQDKVMKITEQKRDLNAGMSIRTPSSSRNPDTPKRKKDPADSSKTTDVVDMPPPPPPQV